MRRTNNYQSLASASQSQAAEESEDEDVDENSNTFDQQLAETGDTESIDTSFLTDTTMLDSLFPSPNSIQFSNLSSAGLSPAPQPNQQPLPQTIDLSSMTFNNCPSPHQTRTFDVSTSTFHPQDAFVNVVDPSMTAALFDASTSLASQNFGIDDHFGGLDFTNLPSNAFFA